MAYEQRDNSGTVFENDRKQTDKHPDYTGRAMIDGTMYWVSMWVKVKQDGSEFFSFSVNPMDDTQQEPRRQEPQRQSRRVQPQSQPQGNRGGRAPSRSSGFDDLPDDDIPW